MTFEEIAALNILRRTNRRNKKDPVDELLAQIKKELKEERKKKRS